MSTRVDWHVTQEDSTALLNSFVSREELLRSNTARYDAALRRARLRTLVAVSSGSPDSNSGGPITTNIYQNGTLVTSLSGWAVGWLDNSRLLVNNYSANQPAYLGANIYGPTGTQLASPPVPELRAIQPVTSDLVYAPAINQILSLTTGAPSWVSGDPTGGLGAVAGSEVVFLSGNLVLGQPY